MKYTKIWHIMYLPVFGNVDENLLINLATIVIFIGIYLWHMRHDHSHRDKQAHHEESLLNEVKEIKEEIKKITKQEERR